MKLRNKILIIIFMIIFGCFVSFPVNASETISYDGITTVMPEIVSNTDDEDPEAPQNNIENYITSITTPVGYANGMEISSEDLIEKYASDTTVVGIDVSKWQGEIDWKKVKDSGIKYAIIRCGYRGYGSNGTLVKDDYFKQNIEGALENDLEVGVYFFSAAINKAEAIQEAKLVLDACEGYDIKFPIIYDFEYFGENFDSQSGNPYRTNGLSNKQINENAKAFLGYIRENSNYKTMLYGSSYYLKTVWDVEEYLTENDIWLAHYPSEITSDKSTYNGEYQMWQCTDIGIVPGIDGPVDMNFDYTYYPFINNKTIFLDIKSDDWHYNPIKYCKDNGIILGYGETREYFMPDEKITRGMFVTILYRMAGKPEINEELAKDFPDVKEGAYYEKSVKWASSIGIVNGFEDGTFGPNKPIIRQDLIIMFRKYVNKILEKDVTIKDENYILSFDDHNKVNDYAMTAVKWAVENKVITGKISGSKVYVNPLGTATRAETASIIRKYIVNSKIDSFDNEFRVKGKLNISKINLECNILENATASSLEVAPGILAISQCESILRTVDTLNECGSNVVVTGHNYKNEEAFSNLKKLAVGDSFYITDEYGNVVEYTIYKIYYTDMTDVDYIERELNINVREITLTTISDDGEQRLIILAKDK